MRNSSAASAKDSAASAFDPDFFYRKGRRVFRRGTQRRQGEHEDDKIMRDKIMKQEIGIILSSIILSVPHQSASGRR